MMNHVRTYVLLGILACQALMGAEPAPDDRTLLTMALRRLTAGDFGITFEQMIRMQGRMDDQLRASGEPTIVKRGDEKPGGIFPIRFRVPAKNRGIDDVIIIDARVSRDDFGDLSMEFRFNGDQTFVEREKLGLLRQLDKQEEERRDPGRTLESEIAVSLKAGVFPAEVQFQGGNYEDLDKNGIGDFASDLAVLSGDRPVIINGQPIVMSLLPKGFGTKLEERGMKVKVLADHEKGFWCFVVLPSGAKTFAVSHEGIVRTFPGSVLPVDITEARKILPTGEVFKPKR